MYDWDSLLYNSPLTKINNMSTMKNPKIQQRAFWGGDDVGKYGKGNIDLYDRPKVKNKDGSISTVRSISYNLDGNEVLIPTVSQDGRIMSNDEALQTYLKTGMNLGKFKTTKEADAYAQKLHKQQEKLYK